MGSQNWVVESSWKRMFCVEVKIMKFMQKRYRCCVCLGEFEVKEELQQLPSCKHAFHIDCIRHWLHSNSTCPLCRCLVVISTKNSNPEPLASGNNLLNPDAQNFNHSPQILYTEQQEQLNIVVRRVEDCTGEHHMVSNEVPSGSSDFVCIDNQQNHLHSDLVGISIQSPEIWILNSVLAIFSTVVTCRKDGNLSPPMPVRNKPNRLTELWSCKKSPPGMNSLLSFTCWIAISNTGLGRWSKEQRKCTPLYRIESECQQSDQG